MSKKIWLAIVLVVIVGTIVWLEAIKPHQAPSQTVLQTIEEASSTDIAGNATSDTQEIAGAATGTPTLAAASGTALTPAQFIASRKTVIAKEAKEYPSAAELASSGGFINTSPFKLSSLVGKKVVLVDFWTYSCINCIRTIPYLNAWYQKYKDAGLVIVGVHTPEFDFEHNLANVAAAVKKLGITYPVVLDNNQSTWNAYQNLYWPHEYLINIDGFVTYDHIGEGNYNETETHIQSALAERAKALGIKNTVANAGMASPTSTVAIDYGAIQTPETYFGAERNGYLANGPAMHNGIYALAIPSSTKPNALYLGGKWDFEDQYATNQTAGAQVIYQYAAKNVYMVASADSPVVVQIILDGKPTGSVTIQANQLYNIVQGADYASHTLELIIQNPGLKAYTFTFG